MRITDEQPPFNPSYVKIYSMRKIPNRPKGILPIRYAPIRIILLGIIFLSLFAFCTWSTQAQIPQPIAQLSTPQTGQFPLVKLLLDIKNADGSFVHGLQKDNIQLLENGQPVPIQDFREEHIGIQLVFVINPGDTFLQRDREGNTFYDLLISNLVEWARRRLGSTIDDLSILVTDGPSRSHLNNPLELFYSLASYSLPTNPIPSLDSALQAVNIAADTPPAPGMKRLVLFITAPLNDDQIVSLQNLQELANQNQVRFYVWLISSPSLPNTNTTPLAQFAEQTQGSLVTILKPQDIPDLESLLAPLRNSYFVSYTSQIKTAGEQQISAEINTKSFNIKVPTLKFNLDLKPPNPAFISPPTEIIRQTLNTSSNTSTQLTSSGDLQPRQVQLKLLIDFPDGRQRPIVLARFIVDGTTLNEIKQPPFDQLTWDLTPYKQSGQHVIQVEVVDELGLSGKTIETPIYIKVDRPPQPALTFLNHNLIWIAISVIVFSAAVYLLILIMGGRLSPASQRMSQRLSSRRKATSDPLLQTVPVSPLPTRTYPQKSGTNPKTTNQNPSPVYAYLTPLAGVNSEKTTTLYSITTIETVIGNRRGAVQYIIDDPSVDALHARLVMLENGRFRLYDNGSLYGTWVNYTPISQEGTILENGDLIHFGKVGFRFTIA